MAEQLAALGFHAAQPLASNFDTIHARARKSVKKARGRRDDSQSDNDDGYYSNHRGGARAKSSGGDYYNNSDRAPRSRRDRDYDSYDSEGSIPPVSRRRRAHSTKGSGAVVSTRGGGGSRHHSSSSSSNSSSSNSDSDLPSSTDDERKERKIRRGELLTGGLAAVASVHAAGTVWSSMEARNAREEAVANGTLSKEEAKKERRKNQFQDVAAMGLAALAIKGAYGKWKGTMTEHQKKLQHKKEREERHQKRCEKGMDRASRRLGDGSSQGGGGGGGRKMIDSGRPDYNRTFSHSENDLPRSGGGRRDDRGGRDYDRYDGDYDRDYDRGGYDRAYDRYSRDV